MIILHAILFTYEILMETAFFSGFIDKYQVYRVNVCWEYCFGYPEQRKETVN